VEPALTETIEERKAPKPSRRRRRLPLSFIIAGLAILAAVGYLVYANTQSNAVYYMTVAELHNCATCATQQSVRVAGVVQKGSIVRNDAAGQIKFVITEGGQALHVTYNGVVPDIFQPGLTVVVEGHYTGQGPFNAQDLLTKCPSHFESATPVSS
jgi:cytochrome c-type biogenesis protein CcmE